MSVTEVEKLRKKYAQMLNKKLQPILKEREKIQELKYSEIKHDGAHVCSIDDKTMETKLAKAMEKEMKWCTCVKTY